jgi:hypothetical protein
MPGQTFCSQTQAVTLKLQLSVQTQSLSCPSSLCILEEVEKHHDVFTWIWSFITGTEQIQKE